MNWEVRQIPFADRAPVAIKTLEIIAAQGSALTLDVLDGLPLFALIRQEEAAGEELEGLLWLAKMGTAEAMVPLYWFRDWTGAEKMSEALMDEMAEMEVSAISMASNTKDEREVAKALGFTMQPRRYWRFEPTGTP